MVAGNGELWSLFFPHKGLHSSTPTQAQVLALRYGNLIRNTSKEFTLATSAFNRIFPGISSLPLREQAQRAVKIPPHF